MKTKLILFICSIMLLCSCSNDYISEGKPKINPETATTLEVLNNMDTTKTYYSYIKDDTLVLVNTKTRIVEVRIMDHSAMTVTFFIMFLLSFIVAVILSFEV